MTDKQLVATPLLANALLQAYPNLAKHACKSGACGLFGKNIKGALLPHLVEHLAIELLVQADTHRGGGAAGRIYAGNTTWLSRNSGTMRVRISYYDANATLDALNQAVAHINGLLIAF
jgi:hypothetical protein